MARGLNSAWASSRTVATMRRCSSVSFKNTIHLRQTMPYPARPPLAGSVGGGCNRLDEVPNAHEHLRAHGDQSCAFRFERADIAAHQRAGMAHRQTFARSTSGDEGEHGLMKAAVVDRGRKFFRLRSSDL